MKTQSRLSILLLILSITLLSSCALGGFVIKENDGFGNNSSQQKQLANINTEVIMN